MLYTYSIQIQSSILTCIFLIFVISAKITVSDAAKVSGNRPVVQINKCCPFQKYLVSNQTCVLGHKEKWVPSIYMINRRKFFDPRGEAPQFFRFSENVKPNNEQCSRIELMVGGPTKFLLFSNGTLYLAEKLLFISPSEFCIDKESALICFPKEENTTQFALKRPKVKKCCTPDHVYNRDNKTCTMLKNDKRHPIHTLQFFNKSTTELNYGFPDCINASYALAGLLRPELFDVGSGNLILESGKELKTESFCIEQTIGENKIKNEDTEQLYGNSFDRLHENDSILTSETLSANSENLFAYDPHLHIFTCSEHFSQVSDYVPPMSLNKPTDNIKDEDNLRFILLAVGLLISVIFLIATLATGFLMPTNHHVLHWKCQCYYVGCLLIGDLLLAISQIAGTSIIGEYCIAMAILMHFFFLAAFFWLNTMCFNIWWTFRDFRPTSLEKNQEVLRLRIYSVYAWGVPLIIVAVAAILDFLPDNENILRPRFGEKKCWFYGDKEILTFFFGPMGILLLINLILFGSTARQLTCGLWKIDDVKSTTEKAALGRVCLKLVIVMGVTWIADIVSWLVGGNWYIWCFTDLINALQGVFIFIVVGCQPQVWSALKRIWTTKTGLGVTTNINRPQHSSSSHGLPSIGESVTNNTLTNTTSNTTTTKVPMETVC